MASPFATRAFSQIPLLSGVANMSGITVVGVDAGGNDKRLALGGANSIPFVDQNGFLQGCGITPALFSGVNGRLIQIQIINPGAGTFGTSVSGFTNNAYLEIVGGGGAGGGAVAAAANASIGGGGQAGSYVNKWMVGLIPGHVYNFTIGAGGTGVAGAAGNNGGFSSFANGVVGVEVDAFGGKGGLTLASGTSLAFADGGWQVGGGTNGNLMFAGPSGGVGTRLSGTVAMSGRGGDSRFGAGGRALIAALAGIAADGRGGGGGGALSFSASSFAGGNGQDGAIILWEFT